MGISQYGKLNDTCGFKRRRRKRLVTFFIVERKYGQEFVGYKEAINTELLNTKMN